MSTAVDNATRRNSIALAFIGFGEAAGAFLKGWRSEGPTPRASAYDIKTDSADATVADAKRADYAAAGADGCETPAKALEGAGAIFSVVTADQALAAAQNAAGIDLAGAIYFDCNSCSPGTKRQAAALIEKAGGRYVDVAVMSPVDAKLHKTPLLISGPHAGEGLEVLNALSMSAEVVDGDIGTASSIKMVRSIVVKGLEAITLECVLAGRRAGVDERVLASLEASYPGFGWTERAAYMMERAMTHGIRRAAEMREVAVTVDELGIGPFMSAATAQRQDEAGALKLDAKAIGEGDYRKLADAILAALPVAMKS